MFTVPSYFPLFGLRPGVVTPDVIPVVSEYRTYKGKSIGHLEVSEVNVTVGKALVSEDSNANP